MTEETLFAAALERSTPAERAGFLDEACSGDKSLRQRVEALLRSHEQPDFLKTPAVQRAAEIVGGACAGATREEAPSGDAGSADSVSGPAAAPELEGRLRQGLACVQQLRWVLHRPSPGDAKQARVISARGSSSEFSSEIQALLHKRLRLGGLVLCGLYTYFLIVWLQRIARNYDVVAQEWFHLASAGFMLSAFAVLSAVLLRKRALSVRQLRAIEITCLGLIVANQVWQHYWELFVHEELAHFHSLAGTKEDSEDLLFLQSCSMTLSTALLIIGYAAWIPSDWRRCTLVVSVLGLAPLTISTAAGFATLTIPATFLSFYTLPMVLFLTVAVLIAAYGSHRMQELRQEAYEARKLGQYQLKQRLGTGGMGEVYLAEHVLLKQPCAIKLIRPERAGDAAILRRFEREVQATARLKHWNTVQIFDYGHAADGTFYYVMEYLPGATLEELVKRHGPLPPARAVHLLRQACAALQEAHAMGLVHRDIKPANIMVCERGGVHDVVKLLDFGLVKAVGFDSDEKLTEQGTIAGTPAYLSPEQGAGQEELDARSDIYSLGATAYFLLTGQPPFQGTNAIQLIVAHLREPARPLMDLQPEAPADVQAVVLRCLEKDPARRFLNVNSLLDALAACGCAGQWTEELAAGWWRTHAEAVDAGAGADVGAPSCTGSNQAVFLEAAGPS